jgi:hypothetical protein
MLRYFVGWAMPTFGFRSIQISIKIGNWWAGIAHPEKLAIKLAHRSIYYLLQTNSHYVQNALHVRLPVQLQ